MRFSIAIATALATLLAAVPAQGPILAATAADIGLTMQIGTPTSPSLAVAGQVCGPFTCTPFVSGSPTAAAISLVRTVRIYGDANELFVLAMSTSVAAQPCVPVPGIANALILGQPAVVVAFGVIGPYLPGASVTCRQGVAVHQLTLPPLAPSVVPFRIQALTYSFARQGPAFTVAVQGYAH